MKKEFRIQNEILNVPGHAASSLFSPFTLHYFYLDFFVPPLAGAGFSFVEHGFFAPLLHAIVESPPSRLNALCDKGNAREMQEGFWKFSVPIFLSCFCYFMYSFRQLTGCTATMEKKPGWKRLRRIALLLLGALAGLFILAALVLFLVSRWVDSNRLPQELLKAPLEMPTPKPVASASAHSLPPLHFENAPGIMSYEELLKLRRTQDPSQAAIPLYLELSRIYKGNTSDIASEDSLYCEYNHYFSDSSVTSITSDQVRWLKSQAPLIDLLHRLAKAGPLPGISGKERKLLMSRSIGDLDPEFNFIDSYQNTLIQFSRMCFQEKNYHDASQSLQDSLRLLLIFQNDERPVMKINFWKTQDWSIHDQVLNWLETPDAPMDELRQLYARLEETAAAMAPPGHITRNLTLIYLDHRESIIHSMTQPYLKTDVYGYDVRPLFVERGRQKYFSFISLPFLKNDNDEPYDVPIPKVSRIVTALVTAMRNKRHSAEALRNFDRIWEHWIDNSKDAAKKPDEGINPQDVMASFLFNTDYEFNSLTANLPAAQISDPWRVSEARLELLRLGLRWRVDRGSTLAERAKDLGAEPNSPWRDPFTGRAMMLDDVTSPTLVYSLGPDRLDQHGALLYDPTNGTMSAGDLVLKLTR